MLDDIITQMVYWGRCITSQDPRRVILEFFYQKLQRICQTWTSGTFSPSRWRCADGASCTASIFSSDHTVKSTCWQLMSVRNAQLPEETRGTGNLNKTNSYSIKLGKQFLLSAYVSKNPAINWRIQKSATTATPELFPLTFSDFPRGASPSSNQLLSVKMYLCVSFFSITELRNGRPWNHQDMGGGLRVDITEGNALQKTQRQRISEKTNGKVNKENRKCIKEIKKKKKGRERNILGRAGCNELEFFFIHVGTVLFTNFSVLGWSNGVHPH